jgi:hypothetical protein
VFAPSTSWRLGVFAVHAGADCELCDDRVGTDAVNLSGKFQI